MRAPEKLHNILGRRMFEQDHLRVFEHRVADLGNSLYSAATTIPATDAENWRTSDETIGSRSMSTHSITTPPR